MPTASDSRTLRALKSSLVWDSHGCMPLRPDDERFLPQLKRYVDAGVRVVGLNVGFDGEPWHKTVQMLAHFRRWLRSAGAPYVLLETPAELAKLKGRLGVFFDIEGGAALNQQLSMVQLYSELGVRCMLIAYNKNNALGGGCQDVDCGLTPFGAAVMSEMERVGMTVCCSHTGYRTTMDVMRRATRPVIFSHSNPLGVWRHARNIRDDTIRACASTGGVVGINGIGLFLGENDTGAATFSEHIDYVTQLVGIEHVGLGLDYVFDPQEADDYVKAHPELFPPERGYAAGIRMVAPEQIADIVAALFSRGYKLTDVRKVLGGNFLRVARATWPRRASD